MSTVTIAQTDTPSRSKQTGPCWIRINGQTRDSDVYASTKARGIDAEVGAIITADGLINVRHVTRNEKLRAAWKLTVTGNPDDTVELTVTPYGQTVTAVVTGVVLDEA